MKTKSASILCSLLTALTVCAGLSAGAAGGPSPTVAPVEPVDISRAHYPMMQGSTSDTVTHLNVLVPRNKVYAFTAQAEGNTEVIQGELLGAPIQDPEKLLHEKVLKVKFSGLRPGVDYQMVMAEVGAYGNEEVDRRIFTTLDLSPRPLKYATVSCMCDEIKYHEVREKIWTSLLSQTLDMIFLLGDQTYVDSFDYVKRGTATTLDIWMRVFRSFSENPLFRSKRLLKAAAGWDDHDAVVDNSNKNTKGLNEALRAAQALYGSPDIPGVVENGKEGFYKLITIRGQNFFLLDNRTFRDEPGNSRYGHFGEAQENWMLGRMKELAGPSHLMSGGMWFSPTIFSDAGKRMTESLQGDHPVNAEGLKKSLLDTGKNFVFYAGDIHFSQVTVPSAFDTFEIVSSPAHSFIFRPKPGEAQFWTDPTRVVGVKEYNYMVVNSKIIENGGVDVQAKSMGVNGVVYFSIGGQFSRNPVYVSARRKIRDEKFRVFEEGGKKMVRVAFFDADDTLRIAPSKSISASGPTDVAILPGVAEKLKELTAQGYLIAIVSNQGGVAAGKVKFEVADQALQYTIQQIEAAAPGAKIHYYDQGERGPEDYYSKPNVGMGKHLERVLAQRGLTLDWASSYMVGDAQYTKNQLRPNGEVGYDFGDGDRKFAENLGIRSYHPREFFAWSMAERKAIAERDVPGFQRSTRVGLLCSKALAVGH